MIRRNFIKGISLLGAGSVVTDAKGFPKEPGTVNEREYWINNLTRVALPVLKSLSENQLKARMPVECVEGSVEGRRKVTYLEAFGRTLAGMAPWLELGPDSSREGKLRKQFIDLATLSIKNAVTPTSVDHMNFTDGGQPLVDAAFLAHALIRAPKQLWGNLDEVTRQHLIKALYSTRIIKPYYSNWLLFSAMVEAALLKFNQDYDVMRVDYALKTHESWYKGDGVYGDGPEFHFDYYNSYVIHPMLLDVATTVNQETGELKEVMNTFESRSVRYASIQERLISPEGTFPPIGRSIAYRCGAFQLLAQMALRRKLGESLSGAQVRSALTAVIRRSLDVPETFDKNGWLTIGFCGHQPEVGESYISTGSLYLCTVGFLPLGLPESDEFWSAPSQDWTSKRAYAGKAFPIDKATH